MGELRGDTYYISLGEDPSNIENCETIKKIVIPEGVEIIPSCYIIGFNNLEEIYFPSSLKFIDSSAIDGGKLSIQGLHFNNSNFALLAVNCLGYNVVKEYVKKKEEEFYSDNSTFEDCYSIYNQIIIPSNFLNHDSNDQLSQHFYERFKDTNFDISFIIDKLNNGEILNIADLQCFGFYLQNIMNLPIKPISMVRDDLKVCSAGIDDTVQVGYGSLLNKSIQEVNDKNNVLEINAFMLYSICHEFQHIRQRLNGDKDSDNLFKKLDYIDSLIQSTSDAYTSGRGYPNFHDFSPDEIRADIDAYNILLRIFDSFPQLNNTEELTHFIIDRKKERIIKAHEINENKVAHVEDYRQRAFDNLLARDNLSENERTRINELLEIYVNIKREAKLSNIDLFDDTLNWFNMQYLKPENSITAIKALKNALQNTTGEEIIQVPEAEGIHLYEENNNDNRK